LNTLSDSVLDEFDDTIMRIGRIMSARHVGPNLCPETLTMSQALLMRALEAHGPSKMSDVASMLGVKPPAASAAVDSLEREGFVERIHDADDRRVTIVHITEGGRAALHAVEAHRRDAMRSYLNVLSEEDVKHMIRIHHTLLLAMDEGRI
jgi:DNA-binding MarR family transcriptional regulator